MSSSNNSIFDARSSHHRTEKPQIAQMDADFIAGIALESGCRVSGTSSDFVEKRSVPEVD